MNSSSDFDPNAPIHPDSGLFGLPQSAEDSDLVIVPVPWDGTASYGKGAARAPKAIVPASHQMDFYDEDLGHPYQRGIHLLPEHVDFKKWNEEARGASVERRNQLSGEINKWVEKQTNDWLERGKKVAVLGGEHSAPLGAMAAVAKHLGDFGILHIDAHMDLRQAYEGHRYSHASIMFNALEEIPEICRLTQVAVRDYCQEEVDYNLSQNGKIAVFSDRDLNYEKMNGIPFADTVRQILATLPEKVWISFDIDGLTPSLCPNTGTPVPGGLDYGQVQYLMVELARSDKEIIGFDLCEVAPDLNNEWDANVGARILYLLSGATLYKPEN